MPITFGDTVLHKKAGRSVLDFITAAAEAERRGPITKEEFTRVMQSGSDDERREAVERMEAAGGYENLG